MCFSSSFPNFCWSDDTPKKLNVKKKSSTKTRTYLVKATHQNIHPKFSVTQLGYCKSAPQQSNRSKFTVKHPVAENSVLSSKSCLFPHKHFNWPPCGTVLTAGMHNNLSLIQHSDDCTLSYLIAANTSYYQWICTITDFEGFAQNQPIF